MSNVEQDINEILSSMKKIKGIHGSAILDRFGLVSGNALPGWVDPESVAAQTALILKASERATKELNQGAFINAIIENERGKLLFSAIGDKVIVVIASVDVKLGLIDLKLKTARQRIAQKVGI